MALPLVLGGPIVRRVEPRLATFWVALSRPATVGARVWQGHQTATDGVGAVESGDQPWGTGEARTLRVGEALHVATVTVARDAPAPSMPHGSIHAYTLTFDPDGGGPTDLRGEGLLTDEPSDRRIPGVHEAAPRHVALGYVTDRLPSFVTCPATLDHLLLVHGGCRNSNADPFDATAWVDDLIEEALFDPLRRPHQHLLTGDQIYADDVPSVLLPMLNEVGRELIGVPEHLPVTSAEFEATIGNFPADRRGRLGKRVANFTTGSSSHLLALGEFAAMYLAVWSPAVWRALATADDVFVDHVGHGELREHLTDRGSPAEFRASRRHMIEPHTRRATQLAAAVPRVRRVLANCATYMMFDDHEVTDDWNLSRQWVDRVTTSPLGRTVVRNGLCAYACFQATGNDPEAWSKGDAKALLDAIATLMPASGHAPATGPKDTIDTLLGLSADASKIAWHWSVDGPLHRIVALDNRTRRSFPSRLAPPKLLGASLAAQVPAGPLTDGRELLVVLAPQPPLLPDLFARIAQPIGSAVLDFKTALVQARETDPDRTVETGPQMLEAEAWGLDERHLEDLLARLAPYGQAVVLSGDVHFSCALTLDYWRKGREQPDRIVQLIASPGRNQWRDIVRSLVRATGLSARFAEVGLPAERLAWKAEASALVPPSLTGVPPGLAARLRRSPVLAPARGWPDGTALRRDDAGEVIPPDWSWRLRLVVDDRPDEAREDGVAAPVLAEDVDPSDAVPGYFATVARHQAAMADRFDNVRRLLFQANVGLVTFPPDPDGGGRRVRQVCLARSVADPFRPAPLDEPLTVFDVPLTAPEGEATAPVIVTLPPEEDADG